MKKLLFILIFTVAFDSIGQTTPDSSLKPKDVAILLYNGVELLDFAGPGEVFEQAEINGSSAFNVYTVAVDSLEIISQGFLKITADYMIDNSPLPDILVIPGGNSLSQVNNEKLISWIARVNKKAVYMLSVCNGVRLLAKTGALDGKRATSHFRAIDNLTKEFPKVRNRWRFISFK